MGLTSLRAVDSFVEVNRRNHTAYLEGLTRIPGITLLGYDDAERCNYQYVVAEVTASPGGATRDDLVRALWAENVLARRYFWPGCHRMEPYRTLYPRAAARLPHTDAVCERLLILPTGTGVSVEEIGHVTALIALMVAQGAALHERIAALPAA
jgi:dTDP-4-amino-4,6-dideoxygalactose transaminase